MQLKTSTCHFNIKGLCLYGNNTAWPSSSHPSSQFLVPILLVLEFEHVCKKVKITVSLFDFQPVDVQRLQTRDGKTFNPGLS